LTVINGNTIVIALGGNSFVRSNEKSSFDDQFTNLRLTAEQLLALLSGDNRIVITHGNGPQVGNLLLACEFAHSLVPPMPLSICGAATQGFLGFMIQNTLANRLREAGVKHNITTVVTQVVVDKDDPSFAHPSKPIGPFYNSEEAKTLMRDKGWSMLEDSSRGYRRLVPSPTPISIQQTRIIQSMLEAKEIVVAVGGGGIPSIRGQDGSLHAIDAVVDKDYASAMLAIEIEANILLILTGVEKVYRDFGKSTQKSLDHITVDEAQQLLFAGHFGIGSMEPKIRAAVMFLEETQKRTPGIEREVIITLPETAISALDGKTGTRITLH
jgi:carbamate kinase